MNIILMVITLSLQVSNKKLKAPFGIFAANRTAVQSKTRRSFVCFFFRTGIESVSAHVVHVIP